MTVRGWWIFTSAAAAAAAAAALLYAGTLNNDTMWSLAWGQQIVDGVAPDFDVGPTPHPLPNAIAILLAPLGSAAEPLSLVAGWLTGGVVVALTGLIAWRLFGSLTAVAAGVLFMTLTATMLSVGQAFVDVPYAALVLTAVLMERSTTLAGGRPTLHGARQWLSSVALVAIAPIIWAGPT